MSAALMFAVASHAKENVLLEELPVVSVVADTVVGVAPVRPKRKKRKLPKAKNVDLKEVVNEPEVTATAGNASSKSAVAAQSDIGPVEKQAVIDEQAALQEQAAIEEQAAMEQQAALEAAAEIE
jgi:hypothetical protein|tara:strand:+ start:127 stop:498 length:372 start_codon:yes stop_codon:yes gene_type:complete